MIEIVDTFSPGVEFTGDQFEVADWMREHFGSDPVMDSFAMKLENGFIGDVAEDILSYSGIRLEW